MKQPRWILIIFIIMILFNVLRAKWGSLQEIKQKYHELNLEVKHQSMQQKSTLVKQEQHPPPSMQKIYDGLTLAIQHGLTIKRCRMINAPSHIAEMKVVELEVVGMFQQQLEFLLNLLQDSMFIQSLEWQLQKDGFLFLKLEYAWLPWKLKQNDISSRFKRRLSPSIFQNHFPVDFHAMPHKHDFSISVLHFAGLLAEKNKRKAIIVWPDHCEEWVVLGQQLGREQAKVLAIEKDHVVLSWSNTKKVIN